MSGGVINPTDIPATGVRMGTPASSSASVVPHTVAMLDEPSEPVTSDVARTVNGKSVSDGMTVATACHVHSQIIKDTSLRLDSVTI